MSEWIEEIPYGLQVTDDRRYLRENPAEKQVLLLIMECIVLDKRFSQIALELNELGHRTRDNEPWSPVTIFNLLPRLIEAGPKIFPTADWAERRQRLFATTRQPMSA